jgi:DNA-binding winged helix-turn-helix (wHTH) protein/Tfp pilus assembly protein PilF
LPRSNAVIQFGSFRLDATQLLLWKDGEVVPLAPKAAELLLALIEKAGRVISKDELMERVWPGTFVEEANLSVQISALRKALGKQTDGREHIDTLARRGYRFAAEVRSSERLAPRSLAVLPFKSLDASQEDEQLGLGMADALITRIGALGQILVVPTGRVARFAHTSDEPVRIARELGVDALLDGHVQRDGQRIRVTVQLISALDGTTLWAEQNEQTYTDLFTLQGRLSESLAGALSLRLGATEHALLTRHPTADTEAYEACLRGRYLWNKLTPAWLLKAQEAFEQALKIDPGYARAHAGLADTLTGLALYGAGRPSELWPRAEAAAAKAVELDPGLAEARVALAYVRLFGAWAWDETERELKRAVELAPNSAQPHHWYALFLGLTGRFVKAAVELRRARSIDPLSLSINTNIGIQLYLTRETEREIAERNKTLDLEPDFALGHWALGLAYEQQERWDAAIAAQQKAVELTGGNALMKTILGRYYATAGRRAEALAVLDELTHPEPGTFVSPYVLATIHAALDDHDGAFACIDEALALRDHWLVSIKVDPKVDPLRADKRFDQVLTAVGLGRSGPLARLLRRALT